MSARFRKMAVVMRSLPEGDPTQDPYKTAFENVTDVRVELADKAAAARSLQSACASFHLECTAGGVRSVSFYDGVFLFGSCAIVPDDWRADDSTSLRRWELNPLGFLDAWEKVVEFVGKEPEEFRKDFWAPTSPKHFVFKLRLFIFRKGDALKDLFVMQKDTHLPKIEDADWLKDANRSVKNATCYLNGLFFARGSLASADDGFLVSYVEVFAYHFGPRWSDNLVKADSRFVRAAADFGRYLEDSNEIDQLFNEKEADLGAVKYRALAGQAVGIIGSLVRPVCIAQFARETDGAHQRETGRITDITFGKKVLKGEEYPMVIDAATLTVLTTCKRARECALSLSHRPSPCTRVPCHHLGFCERGPADRPSAERGRLRILNKPIRRVGLSPGPPELLSLSLSLSLPLSLSLSLPVTSSI